MRFNKLSSCNGKKQYRTWREAEKSMRYLIKHKREESLHVYGCNYCQQFHVGHKVINERKKHVQTKI